MERARAAGGPRPPPRTSLEASTPNVIETRDSCLMSEALVALTGAAIGSVTGLLGAFITARQQQRLEALKFTAERRSEAETQRRLAIADLARTLSRVIQLMS